MHGMCYRQLDDCAYVVFRFVFLTLLYLGAFVLMYCRRPAQFRDDHPSQSLDWRKNTHVQLNTKT